MHLTKDTTQSSTDTCIYNGVEIIVNRREINFVSKLLYSRSNFFTEKKIAKKNYGFYFKRHKYSPILLVVSMNFRKRKQSDRFFLLFTNEKKKRRFQGLISKYYNGILQVYEHLKTKINEARKSCSHLWSIVVKMRAMKLGLKLPVLLLICNLQ